MGTEDVPTGCAFPLGIAIVWHLMRFFFGHFNAKLLVVVHEFFGLFIGLLGLVMGSQEGDSAEGQEILGCLLFLLGLVLEEGVASALVVVLYVFQIHVNSTSGSAETGRSGGRLGVEVGERRQSAFRLQQLLVGGWWQRGLLSCFCE